MDSLNGVKELIYTLFSIKFDQKYLQKKSIWTEENKKNINCHINTEKDIEKQSKKNFVAWLLFYKFVALQFGAFCLILV